MPSAPELRELDDQELEDRLGEFRKELLNLRFQMATGQLDNPARIGQVRRDVARALTVLRDREIAEAEGRAPTTGRGPVLPADALDAPRRTRRRREDDDEFETEADLRAHDEAAADVEDEAGFEDETENDADADDGEDGEDA